MWRHRGCPCSSDVLSASDSLLPLPIGTATHRHFSWRDVVMHVLPASGMQQRQVNGEQPRLYRCVMHLLSAHTTGERHRTLYTEADFSIAAGREGIAPRSPAPCSCIPKSHDANRESARAIQSNMRVCLETEARRGDGMPPTRIIRVYRMRVGKFTSRSAHTCNQHPICHLLSPQRDRRMVRIIHRHQSELAMLKTRTRAHEAPQP